MSNPESIMQIENAAMKDLFDLSAMPPRTVFPGEDFERYTSHYLDIIVDSVVGISRLHPKAATCSLHDDGGDVLKRYNNKTKVAAYEAWYEPTLGQPGTYKILGLGVPMDGYELRAEVVRAQRMGQAFKDASIFQFERGGHILEYVRLGKPFIHGRDSSGTLDMEEGSYVARSAGKNDYVPFHAYTLDQLRECNMPRESMANRLAHKQDTRVYEQYGNEALFARVLWRMGRELCVAAGIAPPDAN